MWKDGILATTTLHSDLTHVMYQPFHHHPQSNCNFGSTSVYNAFWFCISGILSLKSERSVLFSRFIISLLSLLTSLSPLIFCLLYDLRSFFLWPFMALSLLTTFIKSSMVTILLGKNFFNLEAFQAITPAT